MANKSSTALVETRHGDVNMSEVTRLKADLEDLTNVDDEDEDVVATSDLFSISSFGVDYPVETLVNRMKREQFYIPAFQRQFMWSQNQASRFIESLLLGLPIPGIFLFQESNTGKHLVIDGQQRLKSLQFFFDGLFDGREFKLRGLDTQWDGQTFNSLTDEDQNRLADSAIHATVFKQDLPKDEMNSVYAVFERINTGGMKLSPQEIRSCIFYGNFNRFLHRLNEDDAWRKIYGPKSKRLKDIEAILRFLAFVEKEHQYSRPMKHFLNSYMGEKRQCKDEELEPLGKLFSQTMSFVLSSLGDRPFRPDRALNIAVFDAVATSIALRLRNGDSLDKEKTAEVYNALLKNSEFTKGYETSTASPDNVKRRFGQAKLAFGVI